MVEARLDHPIYRCHVLALLLPSRLDAAGGRVTNSTRTEVCMLVFRVFRIVIEFRGHFYFYFPKDTQRNTSTAPRRALSFMRNSRTVERAYEALPLRFDPSKLYYHDYMS